MVELKTIIKYKGSSASFEIQKENEGIFTATLLHSEGNEIAMPAQQITLIKGVRYWTGSVDDEVLLGELGKFIDSNWSTSEKSIL